MQPSRVECPRLGSRSQSSLLVLCKLLSVALDQLGASRTKGTGGGGYQQAVDWAGAIWALRFCPSCIPAVRVRPPLTSRASPPNPAKGYGEQSGRREAGLSPCSDPMSPAAWIFLARTGCKTMPSNPTGQAGAWSPYPQLTLGVLSSLSGQNPLQGRTWRTFLGELLAHCSLYFPVGIFSLRQGLRKQCRKRGSPAINPTSQAGLQGRTTGPWSQKWVTLTCRLLPGLPHPDPMFWDTHPPSLQVCHPL